MSCRNGLDKASAIIFAEIQFEVSENQGPEDSAERFSGAPVLPMERRRSSATRRIFGSGKMQDLSDLPYGNFSPPTRTHHAIASEPV